MAANISTLATAGKAGIAMRQLTCWLIALCAFGTTMAQAQSPANPLAYSRSSAFEYDPVTGLLTKEIVEPGTASCVTTSYAYDGYGNRTSATTTDCGSGGRAAFLSRSSGSTYAASTVTLAGIGNVSIPAGTFPNTSTNALGHAESKEFDPRFGAVTALTGPNALTTRLHIDDFGRTVRETRADGSSTVTAYCYLPDRDIADTSSNSAHCPAPARSEWPTEGISFVHVEPRNSADAKNGPFSRVYMDRAGRKVRTVTEAYDGAAQPGGTGRLVVQDTDYNTQGVAVISTQPYFLDSQSSSSGGNGDYGMSMNIYDALGRVVRVYTSDPLGKHGSVQFGTRRAMNAAKNIIFYKGLTVTYENDHGQQRLEEKNIDGKLVRVTNTLGAQLAHQYDAFGNLIQTRDAMQNIISVKYDIRGRKKEMVDPDTGRWQYDYNALGELVWQQSPNQRALGQATTLEYDLLGRLINRSEPEYSSYWRYDRYLDGSACSKGIGKLCSSGSSNGVSRKVAYDSLGRPVNTRTDVTGGPSFASGVRYDANGRLVSQIYPTGVQVDYQYTPKGFLSSATLAQAASITPLPGANGAATAPATSRPAGSLLWQGQFYDARGQAEQQFYGNNVTVRADFEPVTGRIRSNTAAFTGSYAAILNYQYEWDSLNHLRKRIDANGDGVTGSVTDDYDYDPIGRLRNYSVSAPAVPGLQRTVALQYNALGSVLYKSDVGTYSYPASGPGVVRPHALTSVSGAIPASYTYDANGNLTVASAGSYRKISYTSFNLPDGQNGLEGPNGYPRYSWQYDENHQRVKETRVSSSGTRVTWMMHPDNAGGLAFESEQNGSSISNRHYLSIGGASLGVLVTTGSLPALGAGQMEPWIPPSLVIVKLEYWHKDLQGSLVSTTDHNGTLTARYSYDPFGKRRTASGNYDASGKLVYDWNNTSSGTDRGYTGHEHLDDVGLIHMNGRIFDPRLGMFMQGDPFIQDPMNLQNYNRYAYCYNNPMTCTDPSGYFSLGRLIRNVANLGLFVADPLGYLAARAVARTKVGYQIGSVAISIVSVVFCEGGAAACNAVGQAAWAGFSGQSLMSSVRVGLVSGATSVAMNAVGSTWAGAGTEGHTATSVFMNTAGHAAVGCGSAMADGGSCRSGAISGSFSAAWGNYGPGYPAGLMVQNTITSAIVGGVSSKLGGGEFWNGAQTGAFGYLFNQAMHEYVKKVQVSIGYTDTPVGNGTSHALVIAEDLSTGEKYATRAGPSIGAAKGGYEYGPLGYIYAQSGVYDESFRDPPSLVRDIQVVGVLSTSLSEVAKSMNKFSSITNKSHVAYLGLIYNSNSYAFTFVQSLGFARPQPSNVWAPGWENGRVSSEMKTNKPNP
ncbi:RHS repeat-associated core domain-containing protein [Janthinobacterium lividum]|uniref:RHS repeat-associated core domain-containing protein n=1 Tax=Janthinobacterium lividum TaxID=29581 RepID=A0AB38C7C2_9BURK|nr:RHS repeat-associated core domain-containing protein [Janthinobacterium lividum]SFX46912.1 RHS repeat-associated core domain-containing protein [Janthinobacterium lividum]